MDKVASLLQQYDTLSSFPWACVLAVEKLVQWLKEKETGLIAPPLQINISSIRSVSLPRKVGIVCTQHVLSCTFTCMTAERIWGSGMEKPSQTGMSTWIARENKYKRGSFQEILAAVPSGWISRQRRWSDLTSEGDNEPSGSHAQGISNEYNNHNWRGATSRHMVERGNWVYWAVWICWSGTFEPQKYGHLCTVYSNATKL